MESTCREKKCSHWNKGKCPFGLETWWKPLEGEPKLIRDCAPIRTMLMVQELYNQQIRLQQAQEEQRNESYKTNVAFLKVLKEAAVTGKSITRYENGNLQEVQGENRLLDSRSGS